MNSEDLGEEGGFVGGSGTERETEVGGDEGKGENGTYSLLSMIMMTICLAGVQFTCEYTQD